VGKASFAGIEDSNDCRMRGADFVRVFLHCLMPNHWHLLLWPREDGELSETMRWLTVTHTQRWHVHRHTAGSGPVYQGRFKSFPYETTDTSWRSLDT
jgi:hypothetical protein